MKIELRDFFHKKINGRSPRSVHVNGQDLDLLAIHDLWQMGADYRSDA